MAHHHEAHSLRAIDCIHANLAGNRSLDALANVATIRRFHWRCVLCDLTQARRWPRPCAACVCTSHSRP